MMTLNAMAERKRDLERRIERLTFLAGLSGGVYVECNGRAVEVDASRLTAVLEQELTDSNAELAKINHALTVARQVANGLMKGE